MGNITNFIDRSLLYPQHAGGRVYRWFLICCTYSVKSVIRQIQPVDHFETWRKSISKSYLLKISQKPKYIKLMDDNLQGCRNKKRHGKNRDKEQISWKWSRHRTTPLGRATFISDSSGNKLWQLRLHTKNISSIHKTSVDYRWTPTAWLWLYDINMLHQQCDFNVSQSDNCSKVSSDEIIWQMARSTCDWMLATCPIFLKARA